MARRIKQEIFSVGRWNGMDFTVEDLREIKRSFDKLKDVIDVPLKLGHDDNQPLTDGMPAFGWVTNVTLNEQKSPPKLEAEFEIVSDVILRTIDMGMYKNVSVELDLGVTYKKERFDFVLTGVALLGAELPAVNNLNDLGKFFSVSGEAKALYKSSNKHMTFTFDKKETNMDEVKKLQEEVAKLTANFSKMSEKSEEVSKENLELKNSIADKDAKIKEFEEKSAKAEFSRKQDEIKTNLETMVKAGKMTPASRDKFSKDVSEDNIDTKLAAVITMAEALEVDLDADEQGYSRDFGKEAAKGSPDEILHNEAQKIKVEKSIPYSQALEFAMKANPEAANAWVALDGYQGGN